MSYINGKGACVVALLSAVLLKPVLASEAMIGMASSGLHEQGVEKAAAELALMKRMNVQWVRFGPRSNAPKDVENLAKVVRAANDNGIHVLLNVVHLDDDYDGPLEPNACGWKRKGLSTINMGKFKARLSSLFSTLHSYGANVDAVEVGNENDQECYDADAGLASDTDANVWLESYARFLRTAALELKRPGGFPSAKIVTFGIAQTPDVAGSPPHVTRPIEKVLALANLHGYNYLSNEDYKVDGIGLHVYASPSHIGRDFDEGLVTKLALVPEPYRIWVTEWGFLHRRYFDASRPLKGYLCSFVSKFAGMDGRRLGPAFYYSFDQWLLDDKGALRPAACSLSGLPRRAEGRLTNRDERHSSSDLKNCC